MPDKNHWAPYHDHVQGGLVEGQFLNGQFIMIGAGPPFLKQISIGGEGGAIFPIGLTQNFALSQNKAISRIFEIGSERSYFISGRSVGQLSLGRVVYHGPSLLRALYAWYDGTNFSPIMSDLKGQEFITGWEGTPATPKTTNHIVNVPPGYENMFINLASDLFSQPLGLYLKFKDNTQQTVASIYLEQCYIPQHSLAVDSQGLIIQEQVGVQYERMIPIKEADMIGSFSTTAVGWDDATGSPYSSPYDNQA